MSSSSSCIQAGNEQVEKQLSEWKSAWSAGDSLRYSKLTCWCYDSVSLISLRPRTRFSQSFARHEKRLDRWIVRFRVRAAFFPNNARGASCLFFLQRCRVKAIFRTPRYRRSLNSNGRFTTNGRNVIQWDQPSLLGHFRCYIRPRTAAVPFSRTLNSVRRESSTTVEPTEAPAARIIHSNSAGSAHLLIR